MLRVQDLVGIHYRRLAEFTPLRGVRIPPPERDDDIDRSYIELAREGIAFVLEDHITIDTVQLFGLRKDGYSIYRHPLPAGLNFNMSQTEVRQMLGMPVKQGEPFTDPILGRMPAWDAFAADGVRVHAEYTLDRCCIKLVSVSALPV